MIHYHGSPISGGKQFAHRFYAGRHVMISFANPEHIDIIADVCSSFALDNGAFTTWKQGKTFDFDAYYRWVDEWQFHPAFDFAIVPDVIDGTEKDNDHLVMQWPHRRDKGVPVYHLHERPRRLAQLANWWGKVAIGSSGKWPNPGAGDWWERMAEVLRFVTTNGRPWCKLHGLRMLNPKVFTRLPFHSADSCNASINAGSISRFGSYIPPEAAGRANVIADMIEQHQAADRWTRPLQLELFN